MEWPQQPQGQPIWCATSWTSHTPSSTHAALGKSSQLAARSESGWVVGAKRPLQITLFVLPYIHICLYVRLSLRGDFISFCHARLSKPLFHATIRLFYQILHCINDIHSKPSHSIAHSFPSFLMNFPFSSTGKLIRYILLLGSTSLLQKG